MAIYFPELFCDVGEELTLKEDISFDDGRTISSGASCIVVDIKGYGYDMEDLEGKIEFRLMNSQMSKYFHSPNNDAKINNSEIIIRIAARTSNKLKKGEKRTYYIKNKGLSLSNVLTFNKKMEIKNVFTVDKGEKYLFVKEGNFFDLYNSKTHRKELRMSEQEVDKYCKPQHQVEDAYI